MHLRQRRTLLTMLLATWSFVLAAQEPPEERSPLVLGLDLHHGFIIPHSTEVVDVSRSRPVGLALDVAWLMTEASQTSAWGMIAERGVTVRWTDFDTPGLLGHMVAVVPYVEPMIRGQDRLHGGIRLGWGFAWAGSPYDPETNPRNLFYSTRFNFLVHLGAHVGYRLTPQWEARAGYHFDHLSNAGIREPNKGLNFPTWSLGAAYAMRPLRIAAPLRDNTWREVPRNYRMVLLSGTVKNAPALDPEGGPVATWTWGAMGLVGRRVARPFGLAAGTEWVFDGHAQEMSQRNGLEDSPWKGALIAGPEWLAGRARVGLLVGAYVFAPSWNGDPVYQRYQFAYTTRSGLLVGSSIKCHRLQADVFDLRLGFVW